MNEWMIDFLTDDGLIVCACVCACVCVFVCVNIYMHVLVSIKSYNELMNEWMIISSFD